MAAVRAWLDGPPTIDAAALAAFGLSLADPEEPWEIQVYPDNVPALDVFVAMGTQWLMAPSGHYTGLNYAAIEPTMRLLAIPRGERAAMLHDLKICEATALEAWRKR